MRLRFIKSPDIPHASDYEINQSIDSLTKKIRASFPNWRLSSDECTYSQGLDLETELCYLQREIMWRRSREKHHELYLEKLNRKKA
jgi:hypothetical protein